jgi:hypothetical protein
VERREEEVSEAWNVAVGAISSVASDSLAVLMYSMKRHMMPLFAFVTITRSGPTGC